MKRAPNCARTVLANTARTSKRSYLLQTRKKIISNTESNAYNAKFIPNNHCLQICIQKLPNLRLTTNATNSPTHSLVSKTVCCAMSIINNFSSAILPPKKSTIAHWAVGHGHKITIPTKQLFHRGFTEHRSSTTCTC